MCNGEESECCDEATSDEDAPQVLAIQVLATVQGILVQILVDSGSSCSFVSTDLASKLSGGTTLQVPPRVRIADGSLGSAHDLSPTSIGKYNNISSVHHSWLFQSHLMT